MCLDMIFWQEFNIIYVAFCPRMHRLALIMRKKTKWETLYFEKKKDFPVGPMVKTPCSRHTGHGLTPGQGTKMPHATGCSQNKETIERLTNNKCWQGYGEKGALKHCWWECKRAQPMRKIVWRFLKKLKIELSHDPAIPLQKH